MHVDICSASGSFFAHRNPDSARRFLATVVGRGAADRRRLGPNVVMPTGYDGLSQRQWGAGVLFVAEVFAG
jgi:hypothetical protein